MVSKLDDPVNEKEADLLLLLHIQMNFKYSYRNRLYLEMSFRCLVACAASNINMRSKLQSIIESDAKPRENWRVGQVLR